MKRKVESTLLGGEPTPKFMKIMEVKYASVTTAHSQLDILTKEEIFQLISEKEELLVHAGIILQDMIVSKPIPEDSISKLFAEYKKSHLDSTTENRFVATALGFDGEVNIEDIATAEHQATVGIDQELDGTERHAWTYFSTGY
jgi:hypothetical protein